MEEFVYLSEDAVVSDEEDDQNENQQDREFNQSGIFDWLFRTAIQSVKRLGVWIDQVMMQWQTPEVEPDHT